VDSTERLDQVQVWEDNREPEVDQHELIRTRKVSCAR
jgi:hypothetical protein